MLLRTSVLDYLFLSLRLRGRQVVRGDLTLTSSKVTVNILSENVETCNFPDAVSRCLVLRY